jgi:hypothetical protein
MGNNHPDKNPDNFIPPDSGVDINPPTTCIPSCASGTYCNSLLACIPEGTCQVHGDCTGGTFCDPNQSKCVIGSECGSVEITGDPVIPNLFIALDRSCSMRDPVGTQSKWQIAVAAINKMLADQTGSIHFGMGLFPDIDLNKCEQTPATFPIQPGAESGISSFLTGALALAHDWYPDNPCVTNIDTGIQQASADPAFSQPGTKNYVLLVTDGKQSGCSVAGGDNGTTLMIDTMNATRGIKTFVVGFGAEVDPNQLNIFADKGGVPSSTGTTRFYKAEDQASLDAVLAAIARKTLSCSYSLTQTPPDVGSVYVYVNNSEEVPRDTTRMSGWDYDTSSNTVTIYGALCDQMKAGTITDVDIVFGCPTPVIN